MSVTTVSARQGSIAVSEGVSHATPSNSLAEEQLVRGFTDLQVTHLELPIQEITFLMQSGLASWVSCFQNSTTYGKELHALREFEGKIAIKFQGGWRPICEIMQLVEFDLPSKKLVNRHNREEAWSYTSPLGLHPQNRFQYDKLLPVEELSRDEYNKLLAHAAQGDLDPAKTSILQIVTTNHSKSNNWLFRNPCSDCEEHATYRLIDEKGRVFSFGIEIEKRELDSIFKSRPFFPFTFFKTVVSKISTPDYEEVRPFHLKRVTSIAFAKEKMDDILQTIVDQNRAGIRFNYARQNCGSLARELLRKAGSATVPARTDPAQVFIHYILHPDKAPVWLSVPLKKINEIAGQAFEYIRAVTPALLQQSIGVICGVIGAAVKKVAAVAFNLLVLLPFGGSSMSRPLPDGAEDELDNRERITSFSCLIQKFSDIFREDLLEVDAPIALIDWQMRQPTTKVEHFKGVLRMVY